MPDDRELVIPSKSTGSMLGGLIQIGPRLPEVANDGRWHRWNGGRLATCHPDGGIVFKDVGRLAWLFRYGGALPRLTARETPTPEVVAGVVVDNGGGHVTVLVDRETKHYPETGTDVWLVPIPLPDERGSACCG